MSLVVCETNQPSIFISIIPIIHIKGPIELVVTLPSDMDQLKDDIWFCYFGKQSVVISQRHFEVIPNNGIVWGSCITHDFPDM